MPDITFKFEDLPLVPTGAAHASGYAKVRYFDDQGGFDILGIAIAPEFRGSHRLPLARSSALAGIIIAELYRQRSDQIWSDIAQDREAQHERFLVAAE